jgi:hypothetical protein
MYLANGFNAREMYQCIGGWKEQEPGNKELDEFLFRATSADLNLIRMDVLSKVCINVYKANKHEFKIKDERIALWSPYIVQILAEFTPLVTNLRIMQNLIGRLAIKKQNPACSAPKSLNKAMKNLDNYGLSQNIIRIIRDYWNKNGSRLKDYRDLDNHYYTIAQHVALQVSPEEKLLIFLPDNPQQTSRHECTFEEEIEAFTYFRRAFFGLHNFAEKLASELGFKPTKLKENILPYPVETEAGVEKALALIIFNKSHFMEMGQTPDQKLYVRKW